MTSKHSGKLKASKKLRKFGEKKNVKHSKVDSLSKNAEKVVNIYLILGK